MPATPRHVAPRHLVPLGRSEPRAISIAAAVALVVAKVKNGAARHTRVLRAAQGRPAVHDVRWRILSPLRRRRSVPRTRKAALAEQVAKTRSERLSTRAAAHRKTREAIFIAASLKVYPAAAQDALAYATAVARQA